MQHLGRNSTVFHTRQKANSPTIPQNDFGGNSSSEGESSSKLSEGKLEISDPRAQKRPRHDLVIIKHDKPKSKWDLPKSWIARVNSDGSETIMDEIMFRNLMMHQRRMELLRRRNEESDEEFSSDEDRGDEPKRSNKRPNDTDSESSGDEQDAPHYRPLPFVNPNFLNTDSEEEIAVGSDDELLNSGISYSYRHPMSALEDLD